MIPLPQLTHIPAGCYKIPLPYLCIPPDVSDVTEKFGCDATLASPPFMLKFFNSYYRTFSISLSSSYSTSCGVFPFKFSSSYFTFWGMFFCMLGGIWMLGSYSMSDYELASPRLLLQSYDVYTDLLSSAFVSPLPPDCFVPFC